MKQSTNATVSPNSVLNKYKIIAVVGASKDPAKDANSVPLYMKQHGYKIIPINPTTDRIVDEKTYPNLAALPSDVAKTVEVVDVFRPSDQLPEVARQVVEMKQRYGKPNVFWAQLGLQNDEAKKILSDAKIDYVMDNCLRRAHQAQSRTTI